MSSRPRTQTLVLSRVGHATLGGLVLLLDRVVEQRFAVLDLLVLLHQRAAPAAAGRGEVAEAAALEVVLLADLLALHRHHAGRKGDAGGSEEQEALGLPLVKPNYEPPLLWEGDNRG